MNISDTGWQSILWLLAFIYSLSMLSKLRDIDAFIVGVEGYGILGQRASHVYAWGVLGLEAFLAVTHFASVMLLIAVPVGVALLISFLVAVVTVYRKGKPVVCHCFDDGERVSSWTIWRLLFVLAAEVGLLVRLENGAGILNGRLQSVDSATAFAGACAALTSGIWVFSVPDLVLLARAVAKGIWRKQNRVRS